MSDNLNWNNIRAINGDQRQGFEEFVTQLARIENIPGAKHFVRKGTPDSGVECFWILEDKSEWAWQAKYFTASLESSQWNQIYQSIKSTIDGHPSLTTYIIAFPINPADDRKSGRKSLQNKWDEQVQKWQIYAETKGLTIKFVPWWSSDLINRLQSRETIGFTKFWFDKDFLSDEWFCNHIEKSIADLGQRYTPELNYRMPISKIFDGLAQDDKFISQLYEVLDPLLININELGIRDKNTEYVNCVKDTKQLSKLLENEFDILKEQTDNYYDFNNISKICKQIREQIYIFNNNIDKHSSNDKRYEWTKIYSSLNDVENFIDSITIELFNNPYLLIHGEAGIGKSHLLGDMVSLRRNEGKFSLLLLGQQFNSSENPEIQIRNNLDLTCSFEELLIALSCRAQIMKSRIIIFIDAINEGKGKEFWPNYLNGFVKNISKYPNLGLVITIRYTYLDILKDNLEAIGNILLKYNYKGFSNSEYDAMKMFFSYYGIEQPGNPIMDPEFRNPLFLKIYCKSLKAKGLTKIPDGFLGISELLSYYINSINESLCKPERFNYSKSINLVSQSVNSIIKYLIENSTNKVQFEKAIEIIEKEITNFITIKGKYLDELISEGIFSKNLIRNNNRRDEYIYFTYERFSDQLICKYLLNNSDDIEKDLTKGGNIYNFLKTSDKFRYINHGLMEALAIQIPERTNKEIYEYFELTEFPLIINVFLESLKWRKLDTVTDKCIDFINAYVINDSDYSDLLFDVIISVTTINKHFFNAYFLHNFLSKFSLADRDSFWAYYLKYKFLDDDPVKRLIDWAENNDIKNNITDEVIKLASITLTWFLSSPKRDLRDSSTKALISILQNRIPVLIEVLKIFENVNDPYIYERLFAVAYGCTLRTIQTDYICDLAEYVFTIIFDKDDEVYPHILLRDYARNIIEYVAFLNFKLSFDISKVRPPYKSHFVFKEITNEQIDEKYKSTNDERKQGQIDIINSMATEFSRGACGYGDFGRYIFESKFYYFNVKPEILSNMAIDLIFEKYGYSEKKHGNYDTSLPYNGRRSKDTERIGKKYQWIAMHELLARVTDNCKKISRYGSDPEENIPYKGPWEPFVRDIDPTVIIKQMGYIKQIGSNNRHWWEKEMKFNFNSSKDEWVSNKNDLSTVKHIIKIKDNSNHDWLIIQAYPDWSEHRKIGEKKYSREEKEVWLHIRSYICKKKDSAKIIKWAKKQNFSGRWMPENSDKYVLFLREHYWSPAYKYCMEEDYQGNLVNIWEKLIDKETKEIIGSVIIPTEEYTWEKDVDFSIDETFNLIIPSKYLFDNLKMKYSDNEGEYLDQNNNLICYNPSVENNTKQYLLIKKEPFQKFLDENDLEIFWTFLGEKQILGGDLRGFHGRLDFNGVYHLKNDGTIIGSMNTFQLPSQI
ncbi:hypothetical protein [Treponema sp. R6D11]